MTSILVVSVDCPYPANHGGRLDILERIQLLVKSDYKVDLVVTHKEDIEEKSKDYLSNLCNSVQYVKRSGGIRCLLSSIFNLKPYQLATRSALTTIRFKKEYDYVLCESEYVYDVIKNKNLSARVKVLRVHNDEVSYYRGLFKDSTESRKKIYYLYESIMFRLNNKKIKKTFDNLLYISTEEFRKGEVTYGNKAIWLAPHVPIIKDFNIEKFQKNKKGMMFVGNLFMPNNIRGIVWYLNEVHELVLRQNPDIILTIAGNAKNGISIDLLNSIKRFPSDTIVLIKTPDDNELSRLYDENTVFINPMFNGAGVKLKNLDAMRNSFYMVSTSVGAEGTGVVDEHNTIIANTPQAFSQAIITSYRNKDKSIQVAYNGYCHIRDNFDARKTLKNIFGRAINE